jgi:hypothetical protein
VKEIATAVQRADKLASARELMDLIRN